ncbi:MAG: 16S rRNA (guanine(966)-N(2))-methyltransferase RsmD [Clostridiales bacterium]|nr:16S rRNA (guanine(966)-N(2))-methyltransferase RsmD [Clostridiales bacterium]
MRFFLRVISGKARRTTLVSPTGLNTRPTADRAKEGLFNILSEEISGAKFLDIFCGSGAIGIEALSRGASEVIFADNAAPAIKAVKENLQKTKLTAEILEMTAEKAIELLTAQNRKFDIIFLDPPYGSEILTQTIKKLPPLLSENGKIIAETETEISIEGLQLTEIRAYGRTKFLFYKTGAAK